MLISFVVAVDKNNLIGGNNQLVWHLPADLRHFKDITSGHAIIMGRKTFESMGRPLKNRRNIVITRQTVEIPGCEVVHSLQEALDLCKGDQEVFVIGGAEIFRQAMPVAGRIYLTRIHHAFEGDTYFPEPDKNKWEITEQEDHYADEKNPYNYSFITLERTDKQALLNR